MNGVNSSEPIQFREWINIITSSSLKDGYSEQSQLVDRMCRLTRKVQIQILTVLKTQTAMGKKKKLKAIKALANKMALINGSHTESHWVKGSEILFWGTITEIDGKPIDPEKLYDHVMPVLMIQNNQRRMKRACLKHGVEGMKHVLNQNLMSVAHN